MAKELIFLFLFTSLPDLLQAQNTKDDLSLAKEFSVTEIRRVMPKDSETKDAKNYATQVTIEDSNLSKGNFTFKLSFTDDGGYSKSAEKNVTLDNNSTVRIIFDTTIPDQASKQLLIAMLGNETKGVWQGKFLITDIKARVAVIAENYLRVTTGELNKVTFVGRPELICSNTSSPCYYSRRQFVNFPPDTKRCKDLENGENRLAYCDDTVTESLGLPDEPTLLLLDEKILNLKYPATNNTYEVLMAEKDSQLDMEHVFKCSNEEIHNNWCNINISILGKEVNFTITTIDENDFVEGSNTRYFNVIPVQVMRLTEDSVFASWETHLEPAFEVFIKTKTNLDDFDYELNTTCGTSDAENRCESLFINVGKDENHIVVVQQGNNAVAKTIQGDPTEQLKIYRISKTEGMTYNLTFMVESNSIENLPTVELIEVNVLDDNTVVNQFYSGTSIKTSRGYGFKSTEVNVTYNSERKFYLVGYNESEIPVRCGVTYVTFEDIEVELDVVGINSSIVRAHVYGNKTVTVGNETCDANSICYTEANEGDDFFPICTKIENSAPSKGQLDQCEDLKLSTPSELEDDLNLLLLDSSNLYLWYDTTTTFEVLALDMEGHIISKNSNFTCEEMEEGCHIDNILPEDSSMVYFTIISIHPNGSLMESKDYFFENVPLDAWYLTEDSVITNWTSVNYGLSASIRISPDLIHSNYSSNDICDSATICEYFFILPEGSDYVAVISNGTNSVAKTIAKDPTVKSRVIKKISKTADPDVTVFSVEGEASSQFNVKLNAKLIEVSGSDENVTNILHEGNFTEISSSLYEFATSDDIMKLKDERKFLLVEYSNEEITGVGPAYVTFVEFDVELEWIAKSRILRESVRNDKNVLVGDEYCNKSVSACYHSTFPDVVEYVPLCTEEVNFAGGTQTDILLCEDQKPENTEGFTVNKLQLQEEDDGKISLSAPCVENSRHVGLALYSSGIPLDSAESECLKGPNSTCSADSLHLSASSAHLDVVVVCISENNVTTSSIVPVEDLKVTSKKMDEKSMLVHWTVANADDYVVLLETDEDVPARVGKKLTSEITCDNEDSCYSTFFDLDLKLEHQLIIHKQGDNTSVTETHIDPLDDEKDPDTVHIEKVSRVCDNETKVFLKEKCEHDVTILAKIFEKTSTSGIDMSGRGKAFDFTDMIFTFTHDETIFDKKSVTFSVLDSEEDTLSHTGRASISLYRLNADVAWVGAEGNTDKASLRVDVGNLDQVKFEGGLKCEKENSPCYFFEVKSSALVLPKVFERCAPSDPGDVSQCDEEVTPFQAMDERDVNITLEDNVLKVVAPLSENNGHIEIKTYDPSNLETNFSKGAVNCTGNALKNTDMVMCRQPVQLPNGQSYIKVIVAEVNVNGKTLKSIVKEINVPSIGVESWVIAVSVLSFLVFAATGSYLIIVGVKKKKLQKWESDAIKKVKTIDTIGKSNTDQDLSRARSDSISDSSISLPERDMFSQRSPPPFRRPDNFPEQPFPRAIDRGYPVERVSHNLKSLPPPEIHNEMRPVNYLKPQPPLGRNNEAFVSTESDSVTDSQLTRLQKVNLSSRVNLSSLQARMSQYKQTRV